MSSRKLGDNNTLDIGSKQISFRHEEKIKHGKTHTILGILRYATNKEITSIFSLYFPLYSNYGFDFDANVTVPNMEPCVLNFSLTEISRKTYGVRILWLI